MPPYPVRGSDGVDLDAWWDENRFQAYEGVSVPGFPNMFMILGPYGFNGASYFNLIENQARHIVRCLRRARGTRLDRGRGDAARPTAATGRRCSAAATARSSSRAPASTANSYYFDAHGDAPFRACDDPRGRLAQRATSTSTTTGSRSAR